MILKQYGVYDNPELQKYVNKIGQKLAKKSHRRHLKYTFTVLDSPDINAFALPGGYIYITRGIMAYLDSEAELAGVLGHEIGHVTARHSVRQQGGQLANELLGIVVGVTTGSEALSDLSRGLGTSLVRGYGRDHELEADKLGAEYLHAVGYDPENMLGVIGVLKDQEVYERKLAKKEKRPPNIYHGVFSTHPKNDERLKTVVRASRKLKASQYRDANQPKYHAMIDGMLWGPSLDQGIIADNRFSHPGLAIALQLPEGWKVRNTTSHLLATEIKTGAVMQIGLTEREKKESLEGLLQRLTGNEKLEVKKLDNGVTSRVSVKPPGGNDKQPARLSAIALDKKQALTLLGTADSRHYSKADAKFIQVSDSFVKLTEAEVAAIKPPRVRVVPSSSVPSFKALAGQSALEYDAESILRLLNRAFPKGKLKPGENLKTIVVDE